MQAILQRADRATEVTAARRLETDPPSAAESVRDGLDETLTVLSLGVSDRLRRSLARPARQSA